MFILDFIASNKIYNDELTDILYDFDDYLHTASPYILQDDMSRPFNLDLKI